MPLSGVHVACGYVSAPPGPALFGAVAWSQTMASAGVTTSAAPATLGAPAGATGSNLVFEIRSAIDVYVAVGVNPDASQTAGAVDTARVLVPAGETRNLFCKAGDRLAWVAT